MTIKPNTSNIKTDQRSSLPYPEMSPMTHQIGVNISANNIIGKQSFAYAPSARSYTYVFPKTFSRARL